MKLTIKLTSILFIILVMSFVFNSCGGENTDEIGIGPVKEKMELAPVDVNLAATGETIYTTKCLACHKFDQRLVGPPLRDVTKRRRPEWIMNMILNPEQMTKENPTAKQLFSEYLVQMTFQDVSHNDARAMLEYFRAVDEGKMQPTQ